MSSAHGQRRQPLIFGALSLTRALFRAVLAFYKKRSGASGAVAVIQRTSSDLKLNPQRCDVAAPATTVQPPPLGAEEEEDSLENNVAVA